MASNNKYSVDIIWSVEDGLYLAQIKELPGCLADGQTPEEALRHVQQVAQEWIEVAREEGREIPPPLTLESLEQQATASRQLLQEQVQHHVLDAAQQIARKIVEDQQKQGAPSWREAGHPRFDLTGKERS